jgi:hypothetical protein
MAIFIWFAWSKVASVRVGVSDFKSTGIYHFNHDKVSEYLFSISDTSEIITPMEIEPPNMAIVCVTFISEPTLKISYLSQHNFINYSEYYTFF